MVRFESGHRRELRPADIHGPGTTRRERTARRQVVDQRRASLDGREAVDLEVHARNRLQQRLRVGVRGTVEERIHRQLLHDPAGVHDRHPVTDPRQGAQVVGDVDDGEVRLPLELLQEPQVLGLDGDVQRRGGLVGDEDPRAGGDGRGPHHPLAHAAAELMRVVSQPRLRRGDPHEAQQLRDPLPEARPRHDAVDPQRLRHLVADGEHRVQGAQGILEDHGDLAAPDPAHFLLRYLQQVPSPEQHLARDDAPGRPRHQAQDGEAGHALAAARLPQEPQRLPLVQGERDAVHGPARSRAREEVRPQVLDFEQGCRVDAGTEIHGHPQRRTGILTQKQPR